MAIPELNAEGVLPPGIHDCTLKEVRERFGVFQSSDRRPRLFATLRALVYEWRTAGLFLAVLLDGSFVTSKPAPNDIDLVLVVRSGHNFRGEWLPDQYNLLSSR